MNDLEVPNTVMLHAEFEVSSLNSRDYKARLEAD